MADRGWSGAFGRLLHVRILVCDLAYRLFGSGRDNRQFGQEWIAKIEQDKRRQPRYVGFWPLADVTTARMDVRCRQISRLVRAGRQSQLVTRIGHQLTGPLALSTHELMCLWCHRRAGRRWQK